MKTEIIYEDNDILVVHKMAGMATQTANSYSMDVMSELRNYLKAPFVGLVQRLDQPVEGVIVFGKNKKTTANLTKQLQDGTLKKEYLAAVVLPQETDSFKENLASKEMVTLTDYLKKDAKTNTSFVVNASDKDAKKAELSYEIIDSMTTDGGIRVGFVRIKLKTGRHHQIRVQFAHANMPLVGDQKYGDEKSKEISQALKEKDVALCSRKVSFLHPSTSKKMEFEIVPKKKILQNITV